MAGYSTDNPPRCTVPAMGGQKGALWIYVDADAHGTVIGADYFTDGDALGMQVDDCMIVIDSNVPTCTIHHVATVTAAGAATITAATLS